MSSICVVCGGDESVEFASSKELSDHVKGGHKSRVKVQLPAPLPRSLAPSATELANPPVKKQAPVPVPVPVPPVPPAKPKPLELVYKWMGECPQCRGEVRTIPVTWKETNIIVAYCTACSAELKQMEVIPIENQFGKSAKKQTGT